MGKQTSPGILFRAGQLCLLFGCLTGLILAGLLLWTNVEALLYGFGQYGKQATNIMRCPHFLTPQETGHIRILFKNTTRQTVHPTVKLQASSTQLFRSKTVSLTLAPGESQIVEWEVGSEDVVWNRFIFVKMYTFASYPMRDVEQTCGILVVNIPWLRGQQLYLFAVGLSLVLIGSGMFLLLSAKSLPFPMMNHRRSLIFLGAITIANFAAASWGLWPLGIFLTVAAILMIGILIGQSLQR